MIAQFPDCLDSDVGADAGQLLAQEAHIDLHVIFHRVGVITPHPGQDGLFGEVALPGLEQTAHHVKFLGGQAHSAAAADQHAGGEVQTGVAKAQLKQAKKLGADSHLALKIGDLEARLESLSKK